MLTTMLDTFMPTLPALSAFSAPGVLAPATTVARSARGGTRTLAFRASRDGDQLHIAVDVPGLGAQDVEVHTQGRTCEIRARRAPLPGEALAGDTTSGELTRTFVLGPGWDPPQASARVENGQLTLTVPRAEGALKRQIPVVDGRAESLDADGSELVEVG